jgi:5-methyltetrahydrofolate--homocysteine methyltransferase
MLVGRAVTSVMRELYPPGRRPPSNGRRIVLASLSGDVHDLGKNILRTILSARGYEVVDCGKDCPVEDLVDAAAGSSAEAVCISGLVTTVIPQVRRVREALAGRGLGEVRVLAGGAALQQATAESLNADMLARTAFDGARYLDAGEAGEDAA